MRKQPCTGAGAGDGWAFAPADADCWDRAMNALCPGS